MVLKLVGGVSTVGVKLTTFQKMKTGIVYVHVFRTDTCGMKTKLIYRVL